MKVEVAMIVDDCEGDQFLTKMELEEYNPAIDIHQAYDGQEALEQLENMERQPDIIFLDINMPRMDGLEFLQEYRKRGEHSAVVAMLTSSDQHSDIQTALQYDFVRRYCTKLLSRDDLDALCHQAPEPA